METTLTVQLTATLLTRRIGYYHMVEENIDGKTYISVEFGERVVHIKSVHVNNGSIYCELRTDVKSQGKL